MEAFLLSEGITLKTVDCYEPTMVMPNVLLLQSIMGITSL
jgi:hypothetical protein